MKPASKYREMAAARATQLWDREKNELNVKPQNLLENTVRATRTRPGRLRIRFIHLAVARSGNVRKSNQMQSYFSDDVGARHDDHWHHLPGRAIERIHTLCCHISEQQTHAYRFDQASIITVDCELLARGH